MADKRSTPAIASSIDAGRLLELFEQAPGFVCFLRGEKLIFELTNGAYQQLIGGREVIGKPIREALPELIGQGYFELLEQVMHTRVPHVGRQQKVQLSLRPGAGLVERYVDFIYQPIVGHDDEVVGVLVQGHDVTERVEHERERFRAEARYRALFDAIDDGFCVMHMLFDAENRCTDYRFEMTNPAFEEHTGLRGALGKTARELVPDLDAFWFETYGHVALTGQPKRFESNAPAMKRWFEVFATRVGEPEQRLVALIFKNVTERKLAEIALKESEDRFRNMADHAPVMMWVTDAEGRCTYLNRLWYEFTGQSETTSLGYGWLEAVHPDDAGFAGQAFREANELRQPFRLDYRLRAADGSYRWSIDAASPRFHADGSFAGYIGSVIDISDRKRIEDEREAVLTRERLARGEAEQANRMKDEFLSTISHELRTPLSSVLGWVHLLRSGSLSADKSNQALEIIERNARTQAQLVEDLLDVGRILAGKMKLEIRPVQLESVIADAIDTVRPSADAKHIKLIAALDTMSTVMGDTTRLQQVVWNLLSNAVKFTPKGGTVKIVVERIDSSVAISVIDNGQGITADFLPHVFERFRQADGSSKRKHGGLGLGLSIVKHLVEAHGGTIAVTSDGDERGATFEVRLPLAATARTRPSLLPGGGLAPDDPLQCPPELEGLRVLVVDDEHDSRELLRALLERCHAVVTQAASAAEALSILATQRPDLVISDIGMPGEDGLQLIHKIREASDPALHHIPVIALTAYARVVDRARILRAGFDSHVSKPVEPVELLAVTASLSKRSR